MKSVFRFVPVIILLFLATSCANGPADPPLATNTIPPATNAIPLVPGTAPPPTTSPTPIPSSKVTFDFDSGMPILSGGKGTPFDQTSGGLTAHFSSPSDSAAFSVQRNGTTFLPISQFSGNYLYQNSLFKTNLNIKFNQPLTGIKITFATMDSHESGEADTPTTVKLTAYQDSITTPPVGTGTAVGSFSFGAIPQGTLSFNSGDKAFNLVVIKLVPQPRGTSIFHVDNIEIIY